MFRGIKSIIILLIVGILASGMPIYASNTHFNSLIPNINTLMPNIFSTKNVINVTKEENIISPNHVQIKFGFSPKSKTDYFNFLFDEFEPFTIDLSSNNEQVSNLPLSDLVSSGNYKAMEFYSDDTVQYITFEFDQNKLNLPDGSYDLKIIPNIKDRDLDISNNDFHIDFNTKGSYIQALPSINKGEMALTLYFPDNEFNHLIPITRTVRSNIYPLTTTIRNIEQGPNKDLGLSTTSPIPIGSSAGKVSDVAHVRLAKNIGEFDNGSTKATNAINSFVKSLTSLSNISKVQFHLTGQYSDDPFHGIDMNEPFSTTNNPEIYTAYITDNKRFLLEPIPLDMFNSKNDTNNIETIFNAMKFKAMPEIYNAKRHPLLPNDVELLDYNINKGMLTLTLSEEFIQAYNYDQDRHKLMVDGIVFTFMSLEDVDSVHIKIKSDSNSKELMDYEFVMPKYINPEA